MGRTLRAGVILPDGGREPTSCGVPQGGPLSPWLAKVMLDDLDQELERRGRRFARYADDFLVFVPSQRAAQRVLHSIRRFIEGHLRRRVNPNTRTAAHVCACIFLGCERRRVKGHGTDAAAKQVK